VTATLPDAPDAPDAPTRPATAPGYEPRRRPSSWHREDTYAVLGALAASLSLTWLVWTQLTALTGTIGFVLSWYVTFVAMYWFVVLMTSGRLAARDRVWATITTSTAIAVLLALATILLLVMVEGLAGLDAMFIRSDMSETGALDSGGGAGHAIVGTLEQVGLAILLAVPLGFATAVFLNEVRGPLRRPVRIFVDAMSGVPSIVAGLFIYIVWVVGLGQGFSGFAASMALAVLMLPTITRTAEEVLRLVPDGLREASLAMGATEWRTTWSVVLPTARSGLVTAVLLGVARAVGETAPLIMTSFGASIYNSNPFEGAQQSLPLYIWQLIQSPFDTSLQLAWTAALVLVLIVLILFGLARFLSSRTPGRRASRRRLLRRRPRRQPSPEKDVVT
jgi:phosphate transport system permease protein